MLSEGFKFVFVLFCCLVLNFFIHSIPINVFTVIIELIECGLIPNEYPHQHHNGHHFDVNVVDDDHTSEKACNCVYMETNKKAAFRNLEIEFDVGKKSISLDFKKDKKKLIF